MHLLRTPPRALLIHFQYRGSLEVGRMRPRVPPHRQHVGVSAKPQVNTAISITNLPVLLALRQAYGLTASRIVSSVLGQSHHARRLALRKGPTYAIAHGRPA